MRLRRTVSLLVASALVATVGQSAPPASAQGVGFTDGAWEGSLYYSAKVIFDDDVAAFYRGSGSFNLSVQGGGADGMFNVKFITVVKPTDLPDSLAFASTKGQVSGNALVPELVVGDVQTTSESSGVKAEFTFSAAELGSPRIKLVPTDGSCGSLVGFWNQGFASGLADQGDSIVGPKGSWSAHRAGPDSEPQDELLLVQLQNDTDNLVDDLRAGEALDSDVLHSVLSRAEAMAVGGFRRSNCDSGEDDTRFRSRAYAMIQQLLTEAQGAGLNSLTVISLINAGYRSGVFADDPDLQTFYEEAFDQVVDAAIESGNRFELLQVHSAATQLGKTELADQIAEILELVDS